MLDELDRKILACGRRIQKLEQSGYIKRRVALLDAERLNLGVSVFIAVKTNQHNAEWVQNSGRSWLVFPRSWNSTA